MPRAKARSTFVHRVRQRGMRHRIAVPPQSSNPDLSNKKSESARVTGREGTLTQVIEPSVVHHSQCSLFGNACNFDCLEVANHERRQWVATVRSKESDGQSFGPLE